MPSTWRPSPSIAALLAQADAAWPGRDHTSDGIIGDDAHAATKSDHNPDPARGNLVHAADVDADPLTGASGLLPYVPGHLNGQWLVDAVIAEERARLARGLPARVKYIIWNRRIWRSYDKPGIPAWTPAPYDGRSPHREHVHISVWATDAAENDTSHWFRLPTGDDMTKDELLDALESPRGQAALRTAVLNAEVTDAVTGAQVRLRDVIYAMNRRTGRIRDAAAVLGDSIRDLARVIDTRTDVGDRQQLVEAIAERVNRVRLTITDERAPAGPTSSVR